MSECGLVSKVACLGVAVSSVLIPLLMDAMRGVLQKKKILFGFDMCVAVFLFLSTPTALAVFERRR